MKSSSLLILSSIAVSCLAAPTRPLYVRTRRNNGTGLLPAPSGGVQVTRTPDYHAQSDFDYESFNVALNVEHLEYDLFGYGLGLFSEQDFINANLTADDRALIQFFQQQEVGHELLVAGLMGRPDLANSRCTYSYPNFTSILDWINFNQMITRGGESGVHGFLPHLNDRSSAGPLMEAITTEGRQQYTFRQLSGLFPITVWFETAITQSMTWTLLAPHIKSCPSKNPTVLWNNFPGLNITNNPAPPGLSNAVAHVTGPLTAPGRVLNLTWESPGKKVGPDLAYTTRSGAGAPKYVAWISQLGLNYTTLENISGNSGSTVQPGGDLWFNHTQYTGDPAINGTMFVLITDGNPSLSLFNLTAIEPHIVAGPAVYQSG